MFIGSGSYFLDIDNIDLKKVWKQGSASSPPYQIEAPHSKMSRKYELSFYVSLF